MSKRFASRLFVPLVLSSLLAALPGCKSKEAANNNDGNKPAPAAGDNVKVQLLDHDGLQKLIKSHVGKVVVVDVWSTT